ncbi:LPP20 family lipoprotein [bacterium]|nr:LPP20 family lipoprotein [bacterium]
MKKVFVSLLVFVAALIMVACGSSNKKENTPKNAMAAEFEGAPKWVMIGGSGSSQEICTVGSTGGTRNPSLAKNAAVGKGRDELSRMLNVKVQSMLKSYMSTTTGGEEYGTAANDEQHIVDVSKQITDQTLSGTEQKDAWISNSGTFYALVCMDVNKFSGAIQNMGQLSENIRKAVVERAEKAFDELAKEIEKKNQ